MAGQGHGGWYLSSTILNYRVLGKGRKKRETNKLILILCGDDVMYYSKTKDKANSLVYTCSRILVLVK